jgi:hypothetical protein
MTFARRIVLVVLLMSLSGMLKAQAPESLNNRPMTQVRSLDELRARTPEELAMAKYYDRAGSEPLVPGTVVTRPPGMPVPPPPLGSAPGYRKRLEYATCGSDGVALGTIVSAKVLLSSTNTMLFTYHRVRVDGWLKNSVTATAEILVSTRGGHVRVGERPISVTVAQDLSVGARVILFLKKLPGTLTFTLANPPVILDPVPLAVGEWLLLPARPKDVDSAQAFVDEVTSTARLCH